MLANGNISAQYGMLAGGFMGTDQTVALMEKMSQGKFGSRSPRIRALAINIITQANVPEKDEYREMVAIHNWVRDCIRYQKDVHGQETDGRANEDPFTETEYLRCGPAIPMQPHAIARYQPVAQAGPHRCTHYCARHQRPNARSDQGPANHDQDG